MSNTYLSRTPSSGGNRRTFTFSCWCKKVNIGAVRNTLFSAGTSDSDTDYFNFDDNTRLNVVFRTGGTTHTEVKANGRRRDPASWYHTVLRVDTTQGTAADRVRMYINGEETTYSYASYPSQNTQTEINDTKLTLVGARARSSIEHFFGGYLTDVNFCDGQSYGPDSFGETDSTTGEWKPKVDLSVSYGTNGFRLKFGSSGALGTDTSGQSNNFAVNNVGTNAQTVDTASNNFVTMNPAIATQGQTPTYSKGNTIVTSTSNGSYGASALATFAIDSGKWYWETKITGDRNNGIAIGLADATWDVGSATDSWFGNTGLNGYAFQFTNAGQKKVDNGTGTSYGTQIQVNDILGTAYDADNNTITWYINGSSQGQAFSSMRDISFFPACYGYYNTQWEFNFGNPAFTIASGNADANGFGNFEYAVPSGYYALCTKNINSYG